jgi:hypothetical protein
LSRRDSGSEEIKMRKSYIVLGAALVGAAILLPRLVDSLSENRTNPPESACTPLNTDMYVTPGDGMFPVFGTADPSRPRVDLIARGQKVRALRRCYQMIEIEPGDRWMVESCLLDHVETAAERKARLADELKVEVETRRKIAKRLEEHYRQVKVSGRNSDLLELTDPHLTAERAGHFKTSPLLRQIGELGFKRVDLNDGERYHVIYTFE